MKALLLAPEGWEEYGTQTMKLWPPDRTIPDGWVEIELEMDSGSGFRGTRLVSAQPADSCICHHERRGHIRHRGRCLVRECKCQRFMEDSGA